MAAAATTGGAGRWCHDRHPSCRMHSRKRHRAHRNLCRHHPGQSGLPGGDRSHPAFQRDLLAGLIGGCAVSTWTVRFTTSSGGALASPNTIVVTFNPAFTIPARQPSASTPGSPEPAPRPRRGRRPVTSSPPRSASPPRLVGSMAGTVAIAGMTNPVAGTYPANTFSLATSQDSTPVNPTTVVVITGAASAAATTITASPISIVANGTSTSTVTVQAKDARAPTCPHPEAPSGWPPPGYPGCGHRQRERHLYRHPDLVGDAGGRPPSGAQLTAPPLPPLPP